MLPAMRSSHGFRTAPIPSGWVQTGERWALWYNGRETASVTPDGGPGVRLWMEGQKMWHTKEARAANVRQAKRYAERWCAARLYPELPLREAVARLTDSTPIQPPPPLPGLPPTREQQQQAERLSAISASACQEAKLALSALVRK
ncbi:hypothetical protein FEO92_09245 [Stenotrophomonas maltophilia]|nr:hypothetical protein [Stenotrophomonas maltophilia]MBA0319944.1 hypothetical protein [Stenotrophomonas maltophilia]QGL95134.1 hypothetical protein FEO92_09245 [Stenotrophomonas maltophilia]